MTKLLKAYFALLRLSLNGDNTRNLDSDDDLAILTGGGPVDWEQLFALSARQGTLLLTWAGVGHLPADRQPPRQLKLRWVANVVKGSERYVRRGEVVAALSVMLSAGGIDTLVLKGLSLSRLYPVPHYREGGDIDAWFFGKADKADRLMASRGVTVRHPSPKHSAFMFEGAIVENHRTLFDTVLPFEREASLYRRMERMVGKLFSLRNAPSLSVGTARELPAGAAALFLVGHTFRHFCEEGINARQLCDWVVFFDHHAATLDHSLLERQLRELGIDTFAVAINAWCADRLRFRPAFLAGTNDAATDRLITRMIAGFRRTPRIHTPVVGSIRHLLRRNRIYNTYLGKTRFMEFLGPELRRYFAWLTGRLRSSAARPK